MDLWWIFLRPHGSLFRLLLFIKRCATYWGEVSLSSGSSKKELGCTKINYQTNCLLGTISRPGQCSCLTNTISLSKMLCRFLNSDLLLIVMSVFAWKSGRRALGILNNCKKLIECIGSGDLGHFHLFLIKRQC